MRKRLTENVIDANNCERNNNERVCDMEKKQKTNRRRETATTQKRHPN